MIKFYLTSLCFSFIILFSCKNSSEDHEHGPGHHTHDEDGVTWDDLMSLSEWHIYNQDSMNGAWSLDGDVIRFDPESGDRGDLVSNEEYENFELSLQWKIDSCGNSGIMWGVIESPELGAPYLTGPEMQILDDECHADGRIEKHRAGDLYDMISCSVGAVNPAGKWNLAKIRSENGKVVFHLNNQKVVEFEMYTPEWDEMVAGSKFKDWPEFGKHKKGKIALQDHSDPVYFREIKIRRI